MPSAFTASERILKTTLRGSSFPLPSILDIYSRRIMGWVMDNEESGEQAATLFRTACEDGQIETQGLLHRSDNDRPMRGATMLDQQGARLLPPPQRERR